MADALATVRNAAGRRARADDAWKKAIRDARDVGCSFREIAAAAGISHVRVQQIVRGA